MLENCLLPVQDIGPKKKHFLGEQIQTFVSQFPDIQNAKVALISTQEETAASIRNELYQLAEIPATFRILDLGLLQDDSVAYLHLVISELVNNGIIPIFISSNEDFPIPLQQAYSKQKKVHNLCLVNERAGILSHSASLTMPFDIDYLFQLSIVGLQSHFLAAHQASFLNTQETEVLRLGKIQGKVEESEPFIRNADFVNMNLNVVKAAHAPAISHHSPNGINAEEFCKIAWYAGYSEKCKLFSINGFDLNTDHHGQSAQLIAQSIWYFMEGLSRRVKDYPLSTDNMTEFVVSNEVLNNNLFFWKSVKSGRWWMEFPKLKGNEMEHHALIPCSYQDYVDACNQKLPERLLNFWLRYGQ